MTYVFLDTRKKPNIYRFQYTDHTGRRRTGTGTTSKSETEKMAAIVQAKENAIKRNWAEIPKKFHVARHESFKDVASEYLAWGKAQGGVGGRPWSKQHLEKRVNGIEWWENELDLKVLGELVGCLPRVEKSIRKLQARGLASLTIRHRVDNLSSFCKWAVDRGYLEESPLKGMAPFSKKPKSVRRLITVEEIQKLLAMAPPHRRLVYEVALSSGLRAGELESLRVCDFDSQRGGLILSEDWTKSRKPGFQPLPAAIVQHLKKDSEGKDPNAPLLRISASYGHAARDLDKDLDAAKIPKKTPDGKLDFHSLRVAFTTFVIESGANIKEAQALARHSTPDLTLNVYARARCEKLAEIAEAVGNSFVPPRSTPLAHRKAAGAESLSHESTSEGLAGVHRNRTYQSHLRRTQRL